MEAAETQMARLGERAGVDRRHPLRSLGPSSNFADRYLPLRFNGYCLLLIKSSLHLEEEGWQERVVDKSKDFA